jgi:hypothetical protein
MSQQQSIYYNWVPRWLKLVLLIIAMFPHLMLMSLFHSNSAFSASFLDIEPEDLQFLLSLMYGTVVVTLMIFGRFFAFFRLRSYVILMCIISIGILVLLSFTKDYGLVLVLRVLEGMFGLLEGACFLPLVVGQIKSKHSKTIAYFFLYGIMLTGGTITSSLVKSTIMDFGWNEMINIILYFHTLVLIIALLIFNNNRLSRKYPLYQIDYTSCLFLFIALHSGSFALIYGRKFYWFSSPYITIATVLFLIFSGLFILKQLNTKKRIFHFEVLKFPNVIIGVLLFFFFYIIRAGLNNVYAVMASVWKWPWDYIINIQYFNVAGTAVGIIISGVMLIKGVKSKVIFGIGFLLLMVDCYWFTFVFYPDTTLRTIAPPLFLQGVGQGWLVTPLVMYLISGLPAHLVGNAGQVGTSIRFWTTNIGFALMQNSTSFLNQKHFVQLQASLDTANPLVGSTWDVLMQKNAAGNDFQTATKLSALSLNGSVSKQALLLSNIEIFMALAWLSLAVALVIFLMKPTAIFFKKINFKRPIFIG